MRNAAAARPMHARRARHGNFDKGMEISGKTPGARRGCNGEAMRPMGVRHDAEPDSRREMTRHRSAFYS
jgi:hypothetical protein